MAFPLFHEIANFSGETDSHRELIPTILSPRELLITPGQFSQEVVPFRTKLI